ncbi:uncharacterized protein N7525_005062 [Penicillium rubens]|uniref:uncharacterized protein n=1 Tax=Penicillium rubens TaxID=1108849 RepID=UPI002A5B0277|nr:uncharacterized protein N7525_005062 [Penicillium rubens]KAJ5839874.1 hypothetical protein N7525_005062 [Penicillium rubens]
MVHSHVWKVKGGGNAKKLIANRPSLPGKYIIPRPAARPTKYCRPDLRPCRDNKLPHLETDFIPILLLSAPYRFVTNSANAGPRLCSYALAALRDHVNSLRAFPRAVAVAVAKGGRLISVVLAKSSTASEKGFDKPHDKPQLGWWVAG